MEDVPVAYCNMDVCTVRNINRDICTHIVQCTMYSILNGMMYLLYMREGCSSMVVPQAFAVMARVRIQQNTYTSVTYKTDCLF